jgi:cytoskeletal protein CcmA (bactofilin family)
MAEKEPCLIGSKIIIRGQVSGSQDLIVEGRIEGRIALENRLTVEESGTVEADLDVADAALKGEVRGDVVASRTAVLHPTARVVGNIRAPRLIIEEGARFSGSVEMDVELPAGVRSANAA